MTEQRMFDIAEAITKAHEGCVLVAYPDPLSPLAKALGREGLAALARGEPIPRQHRDLPGHPWTIGWGESSLVDPSIVPGLRWTQAEADRRLRVRLGVVWHAAQRAWPGAFRLHPKAGAALISLAYNRGTGMTKRASDPLDRRREMRELQPAVATRDYARMAELFRSMKRLWAGQGMAGLLKRRDDEARLCDEAAAEEGR